jgi:prepilin-type N-terminal cleavage/methylation domain-containing protein
MTFFSRRLKAFTLIELLVVIAIIAIVAAILFPVFQMAKAAAKESASISNVKQHLEAVIMYIGDNDDDYPLALNGPMSNIQNWPDGHDPQRTDTWVFTTKAYAKSRSIFVDPRRGDRNGYFSQPPCIPTSPSDTACLNGPSFQNQEMYAQYGLNYQRLAPVYCLDLACTDVSGGPGVSSSLIDNPSGTIMLLQSSLYPDSGIGVSLVNPPLTHNPDVTYGIGLIPPGPGYSTGPVGPIKCPGGEIVCPASFPWGLPSVDSGFVDGHAKSLPPANAGADF